MEQSSADILVFFGRFHPLFLHLPIGFLVLAFILELVSGKEKYRSLRPAVGFTLFLGAVTALVAALLGLMLAQAGGYSEDILSLHQWLGLAVVAMAFGSLFLYHRKEKNRSVKMQKAYMVSLSLMMVFLAGAGHFGGSLTHGTTYLTQYMPNPLRVMIGLPANEGPKVITDLNKALVFEDIIHPILETRCNSCHNASKKKGELQMHTVETIMKGGENGPVFVSGDASESEMIKRLHLPISHDDHMPPKGKTQLDPNQVALLEWWINTGAPFDKKVAEVKVDEEMDGILQTLVDPDANKTEIEKLLAAGVDPADPEKIKTFRSQGVTIKPLSNEENWLQITIPKGLDVDEILGQMAESFPEQITWLDLKDTGVSDEDLVHLAKFKNLTRLRLEKNPVTDEAMVYLKELPYLEYLNVYGTQIGDVGIEQLSDLQQLRKLYAWDSKVTSDGAARLEDKLEKLNVNLGFEVTVADSLQVKVLPVNNVD